MQTDWLLSTGGGGVNYKFTYYSVVHLLSTGVVQHCYRIHRGSYMSAEVLLNLLNECMKRDKIRGLSSKIICFSQRVK